MTIGDLYDKLDWSRADKSLAGWNKSHGEENMCMDAQETRRRRCIVIHNALTAGDAERRQFCIRSLMGAGVWGQIENILEANSDSKPEEPDNSDRGIASTEGVA